MSSIYVEALYNENRNAIPSWQGYHYQGQTAAFFLLKYILECFEDSKKNMEDIFMKIEWMEDFIIFEKDVVKHVYQVKKTLNEQDYTDVMQNFMLQQKLLADDLCKWMVVYDKSNKTDFETITEEKFNDAYESYIRNHILSEICELEKNKDKPEFWINNLNLKLAESKLRHTRYYIRKLMDSDDIKWRKLDKDKCNDFVEKHINKLKGKLANKKDDFIKFESQVEFLKSEIEKLKENTEEIINKIVGRNFIQKSNIMSNGDIVDYLYVQLYEKLMNIKNKKTESFVITFQDIKEMFLCNEKAIFLWKVQVFKARELMCNNIEKYYCKKCSSKECDNCAITKFRELNFYEIINNCNLEYPKFMPENISEELNSKLSKDKHNHIAHILYANKEKIDCNKDKSYILLEHNNQNMFVSGYIADEDDPASKESLINNIPQHLDIYKEYNSILTKCFSENIDYEDIKIIIDLEEKEKEGKKHPKFMDLLPINFKSKKDLKED